MIEVLTRTAEPNETMPHGSHVAKGCEVQPAIGRITGESCGRPVVCGYEYGRGGLVLKMCKEHDAAMRRFIESVKRYPFVRNEYDDGTVELVPSDPNYWKRMMVKRP